MASLAGTVKHCGDGAGSTEMIGDVGKSRGRRKSDGDGVLAFITRSRHTEMAASSFSTPARRRNWPRAHLEPRRRSSAVRWLSAVTVHHITELPFILNPNLLPNLCGNSKISKNKSCSKFKVLQLCFYNHSLIRSTF